MANVKFFINSVLIIAHRDIRKFLANKFRILSSLLFSLILIGVFGAGINSNLGDKLNIDLLSFTFLGVLAQSLFQSTALGVLYLAQDRESDFSQEIFVSPASRYAIIFGKILGESSISLLQSIGIFIFAFILNVGLDWTRVLLIIPFLPLICFFGASFGLFILSLIPEYRSVNQLFPILIFPQFFLAGIFFPITNQPLVLNILSHLAPMTYAVDIIRSVYYSGTLSYDIFVLNNFYVNLIVISVLFLIMFFVGTIRFVRNERNK